MADEELHIHIPGELHGLELCLARRMDSRQLDVQLIGAPAFIRQFALRMLRGPMEAEFAGQRIRLIRFTVFNQADRTRLVFVADYADSGPPPEQCQSVG